MRARVLLQPQPAVARAVSGRLEFMDAFTSEAVREVDWPYFVEPLPRCVVCGELARILDFFSEHRSFRNILYRVRCACGVDEFPLPFRAVFALPAEAAS